MASAVKCLAPSIPPNCSGRRVSYRRPIRCLASGDSTAAALSVEKVNGVANGAAAYAAKEESGKKGSDLGNGKFVKSKVEENEEELEVLWDDGYGKETVKEYLDFAREMIRPDGGPARWFTPLACGPHLKDSPLLLFLPGMDGLGLGLILHHRALGKVFDVWCMHIPVTDRTPFEGLVQWVEETVRSEHALSPQKPIYIVGDSFGGSLALAVASRNPHIDLVLILANPATSFVSSPLQPLFPALEAIPPEFHFTIPYLLSTVMGEYVKTASVNIDKMLPPGQYYEQLAKNLTGLLPRLSTLADIIPKDSLAWKLKMLRRGASYANSRLHAVKAEVLVLASGKDNLLPSRDEALRLSSKLEKCRVRFFKDHGHTLLLEDGVNLLTIIKGVSLYRRSKVHDFVTDFIPPSSYEFNQVEQDPVFRNLIGPVVLSTREDGKIVRGLEGVPNEGPVLLVGYHMLMGLELSPLVEQFLREKKIMVRGVAHPTLFSPVLTEFGNREVSFVDKVKVFGALPVAANNLFKLLKTKSHVLLYPGGAREALHQKGESYKLFWPDQPEFVRMAAKFGATIVPFGVVGEDDIVELVLDYQEQLKIPFWGDRIRRDNEDFRTLNVRLGQDGEVANQALFLPGLVPKFPGRFYYYFGKPIQTKGRKELLHDREKARELYFYVKSQVEANIEYLLEKRKSDPYRGFIDRTIYRALYSRFDQIPSFEP